MSWRVWVWLLALSLLWGGAFFLAKIALAELGPFTVAFGRVAVAALALNVVLLAASPGATKPVPWRAYLCMGLLNNVIPFSLLNWAQLHISSGLASILNATTPLFTLVVAHLATTDEKINVRKAIALLCGLTGVAVLIGPSATSMIGRINTELAVTCPAAACGAELPIAWKRRPYTAARA